VTRHPDILNDAEAVAYLGLDQCFDRPEGAIAKLHDLSREGHIKPFAWCKKFLWPRPVLDAFILAEIAALTTANGSTGR